MYAAAFPAKDHEYRHIEDACQCSDPEGFSIIQSDPYRGQDQMTIPDDMPFPDRKADNNDSQQCGYSVYYKFPHNICPTIPSVVFLDSCLHILRFLSLKFEKHLEIIMRFSSRRISNNEFRSKNSFAVRYSTFKKLNISG